jgi:hypothetical protein
MPWGPAVVYPENERIKLTEELRKRLEDHVGRGKPPGMQIETVLVEGKPFSKILEIAENRNMDVIVLNLQSRSALERAFLGSTAEQVVRFARTPSPFHSCRHWRLAASGPVLSCGGSARRVQGCHGRCQRQSTGASQTSLSGRRSPYRLRR